MSTLFTPAELMPATVHRGRGDSNGLQWRAEALHLCNWGGFGGRHSVEFDPESTLLAGASGAGKSTLLDAITLLMQQSTSSLNTASNETTGGRNRDGSRSALTYVRGQYAWTGSHDGSLRPLSLRDGQDTWSALSLVFVADTGARFSLIRLFYAPRDAERTTEMTAARYFTYEGRFTLDDVEPWASESPPFPPDKMRKALIGLEPHQSYRAYAEKFQARLGIGNHGDGARALRLLADIQRGQRFSTVADLYSTMVLERPHTYDKADQAVTSFDRLDGIHGQMLRAERQISVLDGMTEEWARLQDSQLDADRIDQYRVREMRSPFMLWAFRRRDDLYTDAVAQAGQARADADADIAGISNAKQVVDSRLSEVQQQWHAAGGGRIAEFDRLIAEANGRLGMVRSARTTFAATTAALDVPVPESDAEFAALRTDADAFASGFESARRDLVEERNAHVVSGGERRKRSRELVGEIASLRKRRGNIDEPRHRARVQFAEAARLQPDDLPFVGELLDMHPDFENWRVAADAVVGGFGQMLLVDERHRRHLQRSINNLRLPVRLTFLGVDLAADDPGPTRDSVLAGRLVVQDGPFSVWLRREVNRRYDHVCVATAADFGDDGTRRVTLNGQTQDGRRGAHGGHGRQVIGFTNTGRVAELEAELELLEPTINAADAAANAVDRQLDRSMAQKAAWEHVIHCRWVDLDEITVTDGIAATEGDRVVLLASADVLATLTDLRERLTGEHDALVSDLTGAEKQREEHDQRWNRYIHAQDEMAVELETLEADPALTLTDEQRIDLDAVLSGTGWDGTIGTFDRNLGLVRNSLSDRRQNVAGIIDAITAALTGRFGRFQDSWPDNNRGTSLLSYPDYLTIFEALTAQRLAEQRADWARQVVEWGSEDLGVLLEAYDTTIEEILDRLDPVNAILADIPFGSPDSTLKLEVLRKAPEAVRKFKERVRHFASNTLSPTSSDAEITGRFDNIRSLMDRVRRDQSDSRRTSADYEMLLDVRNHITISAQQLDADRNVNETYVYLGDKSGGESQELIAFIVGAALRYQLGDQNRQRPRFTPVVLDEGFIKADSRLAGRAVAAWQQLGFQLIIGAPEGQFSALEKAMSRIIGVTKDSAEQSYACPIVKVE